MKDEEDEERNNKKNRQHKNDDNNDDVMMSDSTSEAKNNDNETSSLKRIRKKLKTKATLQNGQGQNRLQSLIQHYRILTVLFSGAH